VSEREHRVREPGNVGQVAQRVEDALAMEVELGLLE